MQIYRYKRVPKLIILEAIYKRIPYGFGWFITMCSNSVFFFSNIFIETVKEQLFSLFSVRIFENKNKVKQGQTFVVIYKNRK